MLNNKDKKNDLVKVEGLQLLGMYLLSSASPLNCSIKFFLSKYSIWKNMAIHINQLAQAIIAIIIK